MGGYHAPIAGIPGYILRYDKPGDIDLTHGGRLVIGICYRCGRVAMVPVGLRRRKRKCLLCYVSVSRMKRREAIRKETSVSVSHAVDSTAQLTPTE